MPDVCAGCGEECFGSLDALIGIGFTFSQGVEVIGQSFDLVDVENSVGLQEWNSLILIFAGLGIGLGANQCIRIDDGRALLAFEDTSAKFDGLFEGHPDGSGKAVTHCRGPEAEDIDPRIGLTIEAQRARDGSGSVRGIPRLHPGFRTLFECRDDLIGDPRVNVGF